MATTQGSFTRIYDGLRHGPLPLQRYKTTVTIPAGATEISIVPSNEASGTVVAVWIDPSTLTAGATIKGYAQNDGLATLGPEYFIDYTVPNPAVETRDALNERIRVHGRIQIDVASATAGDSFVLYVWVDPEAEVSLPALEAGTAIIGKVGIDQDTNGVQAANPLATVAATIADDASLSGAVDLGAGKVLVAIEMPADWTAADLTFQVCSTSDGTYQDLYDQNGTEKNVKVAADRFVGLDDGSFWLGVRYLKVRSGTAASAVAQDRAAGTVINLITKPV